MTAPIYREYKCIIPFRGLRSLYLKQTRLPPAASPGLFIKESIVSIILPTPEEIQFQKITPKQPLLWLHVFIGSKSKLKNTWLTNQEKGFTNQYNHGYILEVTVKGRPHTMLTTENLLNALPVKFKSAATQSLADKLNTISKDPIVAESVRENFITYASVLQTGKYKLEEYLNAVKYVSFKHMGLTNQRSYQNTFPKRHLKLVSEGRTDKEISAYVAAYSKTKLVTAIMEQSLIPMWLLHTDAYNKAVETQVELMLTANSEKVRSDAANSVLTHLKRPENKTVDINIGVQESDSMKELRDMMGSMAQKQQELIKSGVSTKQIAEQKFGGSLGSGQSKANQIIDVTPVKEPSK